MYSHLACEPMLLRGGAGRGEVSVPNLPSGKRTFFTGRSHLLRAKFLQEKTSSGEIRVNFALRDALVEVRRCGRASYRNSFEETNVRHHVRWQRLEVFRLSHGAILSVLCSCSDELWDRMKTEAACCIGLERQWHSRRVGLARSLQSN